MYSNTFKLYYRQGATNFYTVDDFGNLHYIDYYKVISVITHLVIID
jgi:hypothetical protein